MGYAAEASQADGSEVHVERPTPLNERSKRRNAYPDMHHFLETKGVPGVAVFEPLVFLSHTANDDSGCW